METAYSRVFQSVDRVRNYRWGVVPEIGQLPTTIYVVKCWGHGLIKIGKWSRGNTGEDDVNVLLEGLSRKSIEEQQTKSPEIVAQDNLCRKCWDQELIRIGKSSSGNTDKDEVNAFPKQKILRRRTKQFSSNGEQRMSLVEKRGDTYDFPWEVRKYSKSG